MFSSFWQTGREGTRRTEQQREWAKSCVFHVSLLGAISSLSDSFHCIQFTCGQLSYTAFRASAGFAVTKTLQLVRFTLRPPGSHWSCVFNNVVKSSLRRGKHKQERGSAFYAAANCALSGMFSNKCLALRCLGLPCVALCCLVLPWVVLLCVPLHCGNLAFVTGFFHVTFSSNASLLSTCVWSSYSPPEILLAVKERVSKTYWEEGSVITHSRTHVSWPYFIVKCVSLNSAFKRHSLRTNTGKENINAFQLTFHIVFPCKI